MSELLYEMNVCLEPGPSESQRHLSPPTAVASVLYLDYRVAGVAGVCLVGGIV